MSKISEPWVIEHIALFLDFPNELLSLRLVSKRFNKAVLIALGGQMKDLKSYSQNLKTQLLEKTTQNFSWEINEYLQMKQRIQYYKLDPIKFQAIISNLMIEDSIEVEALNIFAILILGSPIEQLKELKKFLLSQDMLKRVKESKLTQFKVKWCYRVAGRNIHKFPPFKGLNIPRLLYDIDIKYQFEQHPKVIQYIHIMDEVKIQEKKLKLMKDFFQYIS